MDDLRLALLIAGIALVAAIYAFTRLSSRGTAAREDTTEPTARGPHRSADRTRDGSHGPRPVANADSMESDVARLGGVFVLQRETSDEELSVDVSILAGLRATYESTLGTEDDSLSLAPPLDSEGRDRAGRDAGAEDRGAEAPRVAETLAIDMSRPLVYLTLVAKDARLSGRSILDALGAEGYRPGLMQLYYRRSDADPSIVIGVANMAEAGVLEPDALPDMETPGLVTFTSIPDDVPLALKALDMMVVAGRDLAARLDVTLCDETRSTLTAQTENHLRERVLDIVRRGRIED